MVHHSESKIRIHIDGRIRICPYYEFSCESYEVNQSVQQDFLRFRYVRFISPKRFRDDRTSFRVTVRVLVRGCPKRIVLYNIIIQQHIVTSWTNGYFLTINRSASQQEMYQIFFMAKWENMKQIVIWFTFLMKKMSLNLIKISQLLLRNGVIISRELKYISSCRKCLKHVFTL